MPLTSYAACPPLGTTTACVKTTPGFVIMEISSLGNVLETARDFTLEAASSAAQFIEGMGADGDISQLLASSSTRDQANGMRLVLAEAARGKLPTQYIPSVVKCASNQDASVRRMVYQFVVMYGALDPNLALMTVNAVQKTLFDKNPVTRCLGLKTISSMPVASVAPIVAMNVRTMSTDKSPLVRETVCRAIGKCYGLDSSLGSDLLTILETLLMDSTPSVQGQALATIAQTFPNRLDLLHKPFRTICSNLAFFNPVCQAPALRILIRYARHYMGPDYSDTKLLLESIKPLFRTMDSDVVVAAASVQLYLGDAISETAAISVSSLRMTQLVLENVLVMVKHYPQNFKNCLKRFFIDPSDCDDEKVLKLRIIAHLADEKSLKRILVHLQFYATAFQTGSTVAAVFQTISACATRASAVPKIIRWLVNLVSKKDAPPLLVSHALLSLRVLMQQVKTNGRTLVHLASLLSDESLPSEARATVLWLVGEASGTHRALACEVLRKCIQPLPSFDGPVRLQILQLAAKLYSHYLNDSVDYDERVPAFYQHVSYLMKYDPDYDNRDRCRMFTSLLAGDQHELATLLLQAQKPPPSIDIDEGDEYLLGSSALAAGRPLLYYISLEDWGKKDPTLRDCAEPEVEKRTYPDVQHVTPQTVNQLPRAQKLKKVLSLQEFLEPEDSSEEEETDSSSGSEIENSDEDQD